MTFPSEQILYRVTDSSGPKGVKPFIEPLSLDLNKNEVLVKIRAVAFNYRDLVISDGTYAVSVNKNVVAGSDASGEIVKVGSQVTDLQVGDRVINYFDPVNFYGTRDHVNAYGARDDGVLCQYKVFNSYDVFKLPKDTHLTHEEASALVCTGVTAWNALYGSGNPFVPGQTVLLLGTGGVSLSTLVLAKAAGAVTIITSSSDEKLKYVKNKYGADYTINYKTYPNWDEKVLEITDDKGVDIIVEVGGNGTIPKSISSIAVGGQIVTIGFLSGGGEINDIIKKIIFKGVTLRGILVGSRQLTDQLVKFVHAKKIRMPIEKVFGFTQEEVHAAYAATKNKTEVGKLVIKVD